MNTMKRTIMLLAMFAAALYLGGVTTLAQHGRGGRPAGAQRPSKTSRKPRPATPAGKGTKPDARRPTTHTSGKKAVGELLAQNTKLSAKLQTRLPTGTNLQDAAHGFKNLGQFVAATHAAHNLGVPFDQLKQQIVAGKSLGKAIHELNPDVDAKAEARKAQKQAKRDIRASRP